MVGALADSELRVRMAATDALREVAPKLCWRRKPTQRPTGHLWTSMDIYGHLNSIDVIGLSRIQCAKYGFDFCNLRVKFWSFELGATDMVRGVMAMLARPPSRHLVYTE